MRRHARLSLAAREEAECKRKKVEALKDAGAPMVPRHPVVIAMVRTAHSPLSTLKPLITVYAYGGVQPVVSVASVKERPAKGRVQKLSLAEFIAKDPTATE